MTGRFIWDWSIEAGDIFYLVRDGKYYAHAMFQQTMTWRGGYVVSDLICDGDKTRPVLDSAERDYYRLDSDMRTLVIEAPRINLLGYTTINNGFRVNLDGTFEANGATINGNLTSVDLQTGVITKIENGELTVIDNGNTVAEIGSDGQTGARINLESPVDGWKSTFDFGELTFYDENNIERFSATNTIDGNFPQIIVRDSGGDDVFSVTDTETTINENLSVTGSLDVTQRRAYKSLSSAGWYRAIVYNAGTSSIVTGTSGLVIDINICKDTSSENHSISLRFTSGGSISFVNEASKSNTQLIDKVRYTYDTTSYIGYVDIHFTGTASRVVGVDFEAHSSSVADKNLVVASTLYAVNNAPSGETVVTEYSFAANTDIDKTEITPTNATAYSTYGNCYYERHGSIVHVHIGVSGLTANTATIIASLPSAIIPSTKILACGMGGSFTLGVICRIETNGSVQVYSEGTYALADFVYMV